MARSLRIEFPGALYHITSRGNEKKHIFQDTKDRDSFIEILTLVIERFDWICHAYVLMGNHYHLLIETPKGNLSRGMRQLNSIYSQKFNRKNKRVGHLFEGRFKSILIEKEPYLLELSRYIALNPIRAGLVENPGEWKWSSYRAMVGEIPKPDFLTIDWILSQFGKNKPAAARTYKQFVMEGYGVEFPHDELIGQVILGSEKFLKEVNVHIGEENLSKLKEIPREQRYSSRPILEEIFQKEMIGGKSRDEIILRVYNEYDFTMKEIGDFLGMHYSTVSLAVKKNEDKKKRD